MRISFLALAMGLLAFSTLTLAAEKEWTLLAYLNGNNTLDEYAPININQMEEVGSTDKINVVVEWASLKAGDTRRLLIKQDNDTKNVTSPVLQNLGKIDMGDYKNFVDFIRWGVQNFPAKHYFIEIWDHGGGFHFMTPAHRLPQAAQPLDISWDENTKNFFSIPQLGIALRDAANIIGHKVDLYASDACLMAMPEVSTELADSVEIYAGSEDIEPTNGWPYADFLKSWNGAADTSAANVAKLLTHDFITSYEGGTNQTYDATFSVFDLSKTADFNQSMLDFGQALSSLSAASRGKVVNSINKTLTFMYPDFGDLGDFVKNLEQAGLPDLQPGILDDVKKSLNGFVIASENTASLYSKATGVSIWIPSTKGAFNTYWTKYSALLYQQTTHWGDALKTILK